MTTLVLATTNAGKVRELRALLARNVYLPPLTIATPAELGVHIPAIDETGTTFAENAQLKAEAVARATGCLALADDSGLCVDALNGAPGLHSARWAGPDATDAERTAYLLAKLEHVPLEQRTARFVCAASVAFPAGQVYSAEGVCEGIIAILPRGTNGFGYDPVFVIPSLDKTLAELTDAEKNAVSHRALAFTQIADALPKLVSGNG